jgi:voltage-gated potassium channel
MSLKQKLYIIIFEADTRAGKNFDLALIFAVFLSVIAVMIETVDSFQVQYADAFNILEWFFTIIFSLELILRLYCTDSKLKYLFSFYGLVDFYFSSSFVLNDFYEWRAKPSYYQSIENAENLQDT